MENSIIILMTREEARQCVLKIRQQSVELRRSLYDLHEREGWRALGYDSWRQCVTQEFGQSEAYLYRQLAAAIIETNLDSPMGENNERQLRPLAVLEPPQQVEAWQMAVESAANGRVTARHVEAAVKAIQQVEQAEAFDYKRDSKSSRTIDAYTPQGYDACQTPPYALEPLLPYLKTSWTIWEPACGDHLLVDSLYDSFFDTVISTDILTGQNFLDYEPEQPWDCQVTNPPFSLKYKWLERSYSLGKPFALLLPVETLGAKTAQELMQRYGFEIMLLNRRVNFHMPNKGWEGKGAQFPVMWLCWQLLPAPVIFGEINSGDYE